ncbi:glycosyltransferase [Acinetobacter halotolerans]|uniref:Glycosyltransferase n=1 Tax=Acinetobacter halotolerans TaxID=1752076 RepID=A0A4Q6XLT6_9GAMM|nr:glycosyltransferase [Acinetobacter halotolerans]RZF55627.1 glycosyltransferase [Acinetobacter halotolerans]
MTNDQYFFFFPKIDEKKNGLIFALLKRAKILHEQLNIQPIIVTTDFDRNLAQNYWQLISNNLTPAETKYLNLYGYFQGTSLRLAHPRITITNNEKFNQNIKLSQHPESFDRRFHDQQNKNIIYEVYRDEQPVLRHINTFQNGVKNGRLIYDTYGYLSCIQVISPTTQFISTEIYYHVYGHPVIIKNYQTNSEGKSIVSNILLMNEQGVIDEIFDSEEQLIQYWFLKIHQQYANSLIYIFIDRAIHSFDLLRKVKQKNMRLIGTIHASHLNGSDILKSTINRHYRGYFKYHHDLDALVVLTEKQKEHITRRFDIENKLFVIPHIYEKNIEPAQFEERDSLFCLTVARYDKAKNLDSLIRIFKDVVEQLPNAYLHIYGFGPERDFLQNEIKKHNLEDHIKLMGYTENTDQLYKKASLFLFSSRSEGFGMAILEALCHGCPSISYDINYGPSDMIKHEENGYLIPFENEKLFSEKMILLLKDHKKRQAFSEAAYTSTQLSDHKLFADKWKTLFQEIR